MSSGQLTLSFDPTIADRFKTPEWRDIPGYEGRYQASSDGQIKSLAREYINNLGLLRSLPEKVLSACAGKGRYLNVNLFKADGTRGTRKVHHLIALTFHGSRPFPGAVVRHLDDDPLNNHVSNLRWGTLKENAQDAIRHGRNFQAGKTRCVNGHEFTPENTLHYVSPSGQQQRKCRTCKRIWSSSDYIPKNPRKKKAS